MLFELLYKYIWKFSYSKKNRVRYEMLILAFIESNCFYFVIA